MLIALAIALAVIFLLVAGGILAERRRKQRAGYVQAPSPPMAAGDNFDRVPPEQLLGGIHGGGQGGPLGR